MTCIRCSADSWTMVAHSSCSGESGVSNSSVVMPSTPFIGVRISWLMRARNSLLARAPDFGGVAGLAQLGLVADACGDVGEEAGGAAVEGEDPEREDALRAVDLERDVVRGRRAVGVGRRRRRAVPKAGRAASSGRPSTASRGTPVARSAASFHDSTRPSGRITNMPSLIDEMTPRSRASERCTAWSTLERCIVRSTTSASSCMTHRTTDDAGQRARRERGDLGQLGLGAPLLVSLDGAERHPDAFEGGTAFGQVAVDRRLRFVPRGSRR